MGRTAHWRANFAGVNHCSAECAPEVQHHSRHLSRQHGRDLEGEAVSAPLGLAMRHGTWSAALLLASATHAQPNCTDAVEQMCLDALTVARMKRLNGYLHCQLKSRLSQP